MPPPLLPYHVMAIHPAPAVLPPPVGRRQRRRRLPRRRRSHVAV